MIISNTHQFVFVKTRKTAGSTVEYLLRKVLKDNDVCSGSTRDGTPPLNLPPDTNGHLTYTQIVQQFPHTKNYQFYSLERNPWDKVISSYHWHQMIKPNQFGHINFETYVMNCNLLPVDWNHYTVFDEVKCRMFFQENLVEFFQEIYRHTDGSMCVDPIMVTETRVKELETEKKEVVHTTCTDARVRQLFANEIAYFGFNEKQ
jgi:hypothetical protein